MLLPPIAALLGLGAVIAYYPSIEPATEAYDQSLVDIGIALGSHIRASGSGFRLELPHAVEQVLRADRYDSIYYRVGGPDGRAIAGDLDLPAPPDSGPGLHYYDATYKDRTVRAVSMPAQCGAATCTRGGRRDDRQAHATGARDPALQRAARGADRARHAGASSGSA